MLTALPRLVQVAAQTLIIYLFLIFCFRFISRRQVAQLTFIELAVVMLLGSSVETAMVAGDTSLPAGLTSAAVLLICNRLLSDALGRWRWFRRLLIGGPIILVHNGRILPRQLRRAGLTEGEMLAALRERGYASPDELRFAVWEVDGSVGVVPMNRVVHQGKHVLRHSRGRDR